MSLPKLLESGDLPVDVHKTTLAEVLQRFAVGTLQRTIVGERLERLYSLATSTQHVARFIVFGSFITSKPHPNDVDLFLLMDDAFDLSAVAGDARLVFDHVAAQNRFGASVFWLRKLAAVGGEQSAVEDWQVKRDGTRRGLVDVTGW
jgi:hypothetical protein